MNKTINTLIVEDEPLIIGVLSSALETISETNGLLDFKVKAAKNCDSARFEIRKAVNTKPLDLVLLDISIPCSTDERILSGEDLGLELRNYFPDVKIIVLTNHNDNFRLNNVMKSINPEGFIIKTDIDFPRLMEAITVVLDDSPFYSKAVLQLMRRQISNDFSLDSIDRQLLFHISKGAKGNDLQTLTRLSKSAIELRKRNLRVLFDIEKGNNRDLINKAELHGFL